jgi:hypothetical protein
VSEIARRHPTGTINRLGRRDPGAWRFPDWLHADVATGTFGSRYDDPEGEYRVLYACSVRACAFVEVLWYHSADTALAADMSAIIENDDSDLEYQSVPPGHLNVTAWCAQRSIGTATVAPDRAFASTTDPESVATFNQSADLVAHAAAAGLDAPLTAEDIRLTQTRHLTQRVSRLIWEQSTAKGTPTFAGIHYLSRHDEAADNWALFELKPADLATTWTVVDDEHEDALSADDPDLLAAIERHGITVI